MTTQQLDGLNENPDAACESCGSPDEKTPLFVDHLGGPICLKCMALKFAQVAELQKFDEQTRYSEKEHFVAEYMLDRGFKMLNDDGTVYGCTLRHIITMLTNYSAPLFAEHVTTVDAVWLNQVRNEWRESGELANKMRTERDNLQIQHTALQKECDTLARVEADRLCLLIRLREIIQASGVEIGDCNIETPGPDIMALGQDVMKLFTEPQVFPMEEAPTDGTRVLIKARQHGYDSTLFRHVPRGESWLECHFFEGQWREWCGAFNISSTTVIDPLEWAHLPDAHNKCAVADAWAQPANFGQAPDPLSDDAGVHCTAHVDYEPISRIPARCYHLFIGDRCVNCRLTREQAAASTEPKAEDDGKL